jgi:hypothetical protein
VTESSVLGYEYTDQAEFPLRLLLSSRPCAALSPGAKSPQSTASNGHGWRGLTSRGLAKMERCALSNGEWIRAAANAIAFSRTRHAAAAPKHQSRCNVWMGRHGEFKCGAAGHVCAGPQASVMRFDN